MDFEKIKTSNWQTVLALLILLAAIFLLRHIISLILLTFIFAFVAYNVQTFLFNRMKKININRKGIAVVFYLMVYALIALVLYHYLPVLIKQIMSIGAILSSFHVDDLQWQIDPRILNVLQSTYESYAQNAVSYLLQVAGSIWSIGFNIVIALVLSLFFILEKDRLTKFANNLEKSHIGFAISFYRRIGSSFVNSFGKVMQVQIMIAFVNSILSVCILVFLQFPQIFGLGVMIFFLGLIPVAGVLISFIPLSIIAYSIGGLTHVVYLIVLILVLHALESYFMNPKLMSMRTRLPIFLTFTILIVGEHFFSIWGLLFGIPLFIFLLDLLQVNIGGDQDN